MNKFFNTAGPIKPEMHYYISSADRIDWDEIDMLIAGQKYFLLHAPRQTGKTSALLEMMERINRKGDYNVLYANIEAAQAARNNIEAGIGVVCESIVSSAKIYINNEEIGSWYKSDGLTYKPENQLNSLLTHFAQISSKPLVLFLDEVDALVGDTLISLLRQIRAGYAQRPEYFPQSIVLCGLRDIRDYRIHRSDGEIITGGSAFNIKSESLRMGNFTYEENKDLYLQHTKETGQTFSEEIYPELWEDTKGQPWLVNALAYEMTWKIKQLRDRAVPITIEHYHVAKENLIRSRATHLDQLADKLKEPRVHRVISKLLAGDQGEIQNQTQEEMSDDDLQYLADLGLITINPKIAISNRIYQEIIPRELTFSTQYMIPNQEQQWYLTPGEKQNSHYLNIPKLLQAFQQYFRENSESWIERFDYKEAGPQLLIQAFLQRIINGGGRINREYGLGSKRTDLSIEWPIDPEQGYFGEVQRIIIELKIHHKKHKLETIITEGLQQTAEYADKQSANEAHLIIFNRDKEISWDEKIWQDNKTYRVGNQQRDIGVWGC